jgi:hypothetical protein
MLSIYEGDQEPASRGATLHVPAGPADLAEHYDLTISHPQRHMDQYAVFEQWLAEAAGAYGLSCGLIHQDVVESAIGRLAAGEMTVGLHLDYETYWHRPEDAFVRLAFAIQDADGRPINLPARSRAFTDKAAAHHELERNDLGTPPTVIVRPWIAAPLLSPQERWHLRLDEPGTGIFIKPANGSCGQGVMRVDRLTTEKVISALTEARRFDPGDSYLVQTEVRPPWLRCADGVSRPAYWRVLHFLGEVTAFWWQPSELLPAGAPCYREVAPREVQEHGLAPIFAYTRALAEVCGLDWFSTELCLCPFARPGRFIVSDVAGLDLPVVAIDYLNDQCDVDVQSRWHTGLPDAYVRRVARRFAELAWEVRGRARPMAWVPPLRAG